MSEKNSPKLVIGFILYGDSTARYLPYFLPSLKNQSFKNVKIIAFINKYKEDDSNEKYLREYLPEIEIIKSEENRGFAYGNNRIIKVAFEKKADYFLAINPDIILEEDAISKMVKSLDSDSSLASVSPKVLRWDFKNNNKTNIIDTCGIKMSSGFHFFDQGQGEKDNSICKTNILGPSGACGMYRMRDLEKIKEDEKYFDENMFMYKEDCDLAYKLFLIGGTSKMVQDAIIYHDRTASSQGRGDISNILNRKNKSKQVKIWSFQGQQIIFIKYWHLQNIWSKFNIIFYELKIIVYSIIFERYLLKEFLVLWKKRKSIKVYR